MCDCIGIGVDIDNTINNNVKLNSHVRTAPTVSDSAHLQRCDKCISSPLNGSLSSIVLCETAPSKGIIVSIDAIESPTIDAVLDRVPLVYDPITKQLHLQSTYTNGKCIQRNGYHQNGSVNNLLNLNNKVHVERNNKLLSDCPIITYEDKQRCNDTLDSNDEKANRLTDSTRFAVCEQSPSDDILIESHDNALSLLGTNKEHSSSLKDDSHDSFFAIQDCVSNISGSVSSLNLDDCESSHNADAKPKKLFTLSLQSLFDKVKRKNGTNISVNNITSTTALILENRPSNLPAKSREEEKRHKLEYEEIVKMARKKELKEAKSRKKLMQKQHKMEEQVIWAIKQWTFEILPNWDRVKACKKTRDLWWSGIPSLIREKVWNLAIVNELNITYELYEICVNRSKENVWTKSVCDSEDDNNETVADLIKLDVSRTFPQLGLFQESGPYHEMLSTLLGAYVAYRPDLGYSQGMSFLAAMLLLNMESPHAFSCFANLLNNQLLLSFFRVNQPVMNAYYQTYEVFFKENLPKLYEHFSEHNLSPDLYLVDYIYTLFSRSLPLDVASRVWDLFLRDGDEFIFRAALGILAMYEEVLLSLDFIYLAQFLTKLPDDIDSDKLFTSIASIRMTTGTEKMSFSSVLTLKLELNKNMRTL